MRLRAEAYVLLLASVTGVRSLLAIHLDWWLYPWSTFHVDLASFFICLSGLIVTCVRRSVFTTRRCFERIRDFLTTKVPWWDQKAVARVSLLNWNCAACWASSSLSWSRGWRCTLGCSFQSLARLYPSLAYSLAFTFQASIYAPCVWSFRGSWGI